jgi:uncharacterized repeat protein (TIGR03803 family)
MIQGSDGNFYGTTTGGGTNTSCTGGCGTIFEFSPSTGTETVLYSFGGSGDGNFPYGGLVQASDGNFYGTTSYGGAISSCSGGCGTLFKYSPSGGTETVLYSFGNSGDGSYPYAAMIQGSDGNLYGTTAGGGTSTGCLSGCGTIFRFAPSNGIEIVLYSFVGTTGAYPYASLIENGGNFYGTTAAGGSTVFCSSGCGAVFMFSPSSGIETPLYLFGSFNGDGENPYGGLIQDSAGNLYGTTYAGGTGSDGMAFKVTSGGTYTVLYNFGSFSGDGQNPNASLIQNSSGAFYGTTINGGTANDGTVFEFTLQ